MGQFLQVKEGVMICSSEKGPPVRLYLSSSRAESTCERNERRTFCGPFLHSIQYGCWFSMGQFLQVKEGVMICRSHEQLV
jgi:hypothetical protein